jgi:glycosyltransferase involved in cell wall biosynthesis
LPRLHVNTTAMRVAPTISVIIPSRNEIFLQKTVDDILTKAEGDIEVIVVLDGYWPDPPLKSDPRLILLHQSPKGMRQAINAGAAIARGIYLMKSDAHCMFDWGFDTKLASDCEENWIVTPRRYRLDAENWCIQESSKHKPPIDYQYLSSPGHHDPRGNRWGQRARERLGKPKYLIDENMIFQGSCWLMTKNHFNNFLRGLDQANYGPFGREAHEIGLKTWLGGGRVMINKKTWYAHLHKGPKYGRMYFLSKEEVRKGIAYSDDFWFNNRWKEAKYDLAWLVERFWPVPSWTEELVEKVRKK